MSFFAYESAPCYNAWLRKLEYWNSINISTINQIVIWCDIIRFLDYRFFILLSPTEPHKPILTPEGIYSIGFGFVYTHIDMLTNAVSKKLALVKTAII